MIQPNDRNADAPTLDKRGNTVFAKPHEEDQSFPAFIEYLTKQETDPNFQGSEIRYAQTRMYMHLSSPFSTHRLNHLLEVANACIPEHP